MYPKADIIQARRIIESGELRELLRGKSFHYDIVCTLVEAAKIGLQQMNPIIGNDISEQH